MCYGYKVTNTLSTAMKCLLRYILLSLLTPIVWAGELIESSMKWESAYYPEEQYPVYRICFEELMPEDAPLPVVTGDGPLPRVEWYSEQELRIHFSQDTKPGTPYRLVMPEEARQYRSGTALQKSEFEFAAPSCPLLAPQESERNLLEGHPHGAVLLRCAKNVGLPYLDSINMIFSFEELSSGKRVQAEARPACMADLRPHVLHDVYADKPVDELEKLTPDTPVPGYLLVLPHERIIGKWRLHATPVDDAFVLNERVVGVFDSRLKAEAQAKIATYQGREVLCLGVLFNAPLAKDSLPQLFRNMKICCGDTEARNVDGQHAKTVTVGGRELRLVLHEPHDDELGELVPRVQFPHVAVDRMVIRVEGAQKLPLHFTFTVPEGTRALHGLSMPHAQSCVAAVKAADMALPSPDMDSDYQPILLPLAGDGTVELPSVGIARLRVRVARLEPAQFTELNRYLVSGHESMRVFDNEALLSAGLPFSAESVFELGQGEFCTRTCRVNPAEMNGTPGKPGVYVLHVLAAASDSSTDDTALETELFYTVHVSDLHLSTVGETVFVTRLSDGTPVEAAELEVKTFSDDFGELHVREMLNLNERARRTLKLALQGGVGRVSLNPDEQMYCATVTCGDDYAFVAGKAVDMSEPTPPKEKMALQVFTDRTVYREGEVIHLFGTLRVKGENGELCLPQEGTELCAVLCDDEDEEVCRVALLTDAYGAYHADLALPKDSDYLLNSMRLRITCAGVAEQVIPLTCTAVQRDSFEVMVRQIDAAVRAEYAELQVLARDYNGMPLSGADICVRAKGEETHLTTDAAGQAVYRMPWGPAEQDSPHSEVVAVSVTNDREEVVHAPLSCLHYYPSAIQLHTAGGMLRVTDARSGAPLPTPQTVQMRLLVNKMNGRTLTNGIRVCTPETVCLHEESMLIPAHDAQGVAFSADERAAAVLGGAMADATVMELSTTDAEGNAVKLTIPCVTPDAEKENPYEQETLTPQSPEIQGDNLVLHVPHQGAESRCLVAVYRGESACEVLPEGVAADGKWSIPLQAADYGSTLWVVGKVTDKGQGGLYDCPRLYAVRVAVPERVEPPLHVQLNTPQEPLRPGGTVRICGQVCLPGGAPAPYARVCLFAVDKGMQALGNYQWDFTLAPIEALALSETHVASYASAFRSFESLTLSHRLSGFPVFFHKLSSIRIGAVGWALEYENYMNNKLVQPHYLWLIREEYFFANSGIREGFKVMPGLENPDVPIIVSCSAVSDHFELSVGEVELAWDLGDGLGGMVDADCEEEEGEDSMTMPTLHCRADFTPTPIWLPAVCTDAEGRFCVDSPVADTLTTYTVYALALSADGAASGRATAEFTVNQPLMLVAGTPFFMSVGDSLRLPVTISNHSEHAGTWVVSLQGEAEAQQVTLQAGESKTLYFTVTATAEGEKTLQWQAVGDAEGDRVQGSFTVRFPAPELRESHDLCLVQGEAAVDLRSLLSAEVAQGQNLRVQTQVSANPLLRLMGCINYALKYPYGCTEQRSSTLMPWLLHAELSPICSEMQSKSALQVQQVVDETINTLFSRQCEDGGLSYWSGEDSSCLWASAHAAMVLTIAEERGFAVPEHRMEALRDYLRRVDEQSDDEDLSAYTRYSIAYALHDEAAMSAALQSTETESAEGWMESDLVAATWCFLRAAHGAASSSIQPWLQKLKDERYLTTWETGWTFVALHRYLRHAALSADNAVVELADGSRLSLGKEAVSLQSDSLRCVTGMVYVSVRARSQCNAADYSAVSHAGVHVERCYETRRADGQWVPYTDWRVGDEVRVSVTCRINREKVRYLAIEDYLPSCLKPVRDSLPEPEEEEIEEDMEEIEEEEISEDGSYLFNYREFTGDRVRAFANDVYGEDGTVTVTLQYRARVVYSGTVTAPPASAQLMYEPEVYGFSTLQQLRVAP